MHNVAKWPNTFLKSCGVDTARFLKYVWPFYNIMQFLRIAELLRSTLSKRSGGTYLVVVVFLFFVFNTENEICLRGSSTDVVYRKGFLKNF